jgi:general secretion pathway protein K
LRNLADHRQVDLEQQHVLQRLFQNLQIDPQLAERAAQFVAAGQTVDTVTPPGTSGGSGTGSGGTGESATPAGEFSGIAAPAPGGASQTGTGTQQSTAVSTAYGNPIKLLQVDDLLAVQGFTPAIVERLRPFLIVLPVPATKVNVNTAPAEVLSAIVDNLSVSEANSLVVRRKQAAWRDMSYFVAELNGRAITPNSANVMSEWFLVNSRIRLDRAALDAEALVYRPLGLQANGGTTVEWIRQY